MDVKRRKKKKKTMGWLKSTCMRATRHKTLQSEKQGRGVARSSLPSTSDIVKDRVGVEVKEKPEDFASVPV